MIAGPGMSPCSLCPGPWSVAFLLLSFPVSILYGFLLIFVVNDHFAAFHIDHSALCPLRVRAAGGALLCSVKVCATNLCCLNLNSQFCCSKHLLPTGQTSPGPDQRSEDQQLTYLPAICSPTKKAIIWWLVISTVFWALILDSFQSHFHYKHCSWSTQCKNLTT